MAKFERFEDIQAWRKARGLVKEVYRVTSTGKISKDFGLSDQIRRASLSVMLNIAEGYARRTNKEFAQFLFHAHGSVAEIQSGLYVALDLQYISQETFNDLYQRCEEVSKMISGLIRYLRAS